MGRVRLLALVMAAVAAVAAGPAHAAPTAGAYRLHDPGDFRNILPGGSPTGSSRPWSRRH